MHRVQEGDTVTAIAERYEISVPTVLWANGLEEDAMLTPGQQVVILPVSGVLHTVRSGERIEDIARRYHSDVPSIVEFNQLTDPEQIVGNELLVIPGGRLEERPRPLPAVRGDVRPSADSEAALTASTVPPARQELKPSTYTIARGDTLSGIATTFGVSAETLMWANGLQSNPEQLKEGQTLTILPVSGALHTVAAGDSIFEIAAQYGVDGDKVVAANGLASADKLSIGQQLIVPGAHLASAAEVAAQARAASQAEAIASVRHTVAPGESLSVIASNYGVDAGTIARANGLASADLVVIGQRLLVPGARAASDAVAPAPPPAPPSAPAASAPVATAPVSAGDGNKIAGIAAKYLGYAYVWGGSSPNVGFDCSGFVWYVYQQAGIRLPNHDLWGQLQAGPRISQGNLQPGDIVFFQNTYQRGLSHNGIYIGGGRFINAQDYGKGVSVASINDSYWATRFFGASRPW